MDPNETLRRLIRLMEEDPDADWATLFDALDAWLVKGGFLPDRWRMPIQAASTTKRTRVTRSQSSSRITIQEPVTDDLESDSEPDGTPDPESNH